MRDLVEDTKWGEPVKVIKNLRVSTESHIGALEEYNNILKVSFNSKYVVNVYDYCQEEDAEGYGYMCVEAGGFRLSDLIKFVGNKAQICDGKHRMIKDLVKANWGKLRGPSRLKKSVIRCLAEGVNDMNLKRIIHRNLDPTSVELFLGDSLNSLVPKICNFGVSAGLGNNQNSFQPSCSRGVFPWLAPEQMNNKEEG